jgi:hypothetical protein
VEYEQALTGLAADFRQAVERVVGEWSLDAQLAQVVQNITSETALASGDFTSLLSFFAAQLAGGNPPLDSWLSACRAHKRKGRVIPDADCPVILGRAKGLEDHATSVARTSSGAFTSAEAKKLLLKYSGSRNPMGLERFLRETLLGKYNLVWATFDSSSTDSNPFDRLPISHVGICTALGLGGFTDTLVILVWSHADSGSPPLHRPTIADAEAYRYYRPNPDAHAPWGLTAPLLPNPDGLMPQPEVVMPDPTSKG